MYAFPLFFFPIGQCDHSSRQDAIQLEEPINLCKRGPILLVGRLRLEDQEEGHQDGDTAEIEFTADFIQFLVLVCGIG